MNFKTFLLKLSDKPTKVIAPEVAYSAYVPIDLSKNNKALNGLDVTSSKSWIKYINAYLRKQHKTIAYGGYLEQRSIYERSRYFNEVKELDSRNIHLGVDLWCTVETAVMAAFDGEIHSFADNVNHGDYGPTIVLKHCIKNVVFYTLYGHLSRPSIIGLNKNTQILKGEVVGFLGDAKVNGNYAPHLHFQIIKDIEHYQGDYPGVSSAANLEFYTTNCPDPNLVLKL